jgi:DNA-binding LytR/AlgR family response regulator
MNKIRTLILDDEQHWQLVLRRMAEAHPLIEISGIYGSPMEAIPALTSGQIDLVLLDVQLTEVNGIDFAKGLENPPLVVFITTHDRFALKSYEVEAVDFLVKPVQLDRFFLAIDKVQKRLKFLASKVPEEPETLEVLDNSFFFVKEQQGYTKIIIDNILFVKSLENYIQIVTPDSTHTILSSLNFIEQKLGAKFMRIHRSYLVNLLKISSFTSEIVVTGHHELPLGGQYLEQFKQDFVYRNLFKK